MNTPDTLTPAALTAALDIVPTRSGFAPRRAFPARLILDAIVRAYERGEWNDDPILGTALFRAAYGTAYAIETGRLTVEAERKVEALKGQNVIRFAVKVALATRSIDEVARYLNGLAK